MRRLCLIVYLYLACYPTGRSCVVFRSCTRGTCARRASWRLPVGRRTAKEWGRVGGHPASSPDSSADSRPYRCCTSSDRGNISALDCSCPPRRHGGCRNRMPGLGNGRFAGRAPRNRLASGGRNRDRGWRTWPRSAYEASCSCTPWQRVTNPTSNRKINRFLSAETVLNNILWYVLYHCALIGFKTLVLNI